MMKFRFNFGKIIGARLLPCSILIFGSISSCDNQNYDSIDFHKEYEKQEYLKVVDLAVDLGVPENRIVFPDSFLAVRLYNAPDALILDPNGEVLDEKVCNADFPDFKGELIDQLPTAIFSKENATKFEEYKSHFLNSKLEHILFKKGSYNVIMLLGSINSTRPHPTSYYIKSLIEINQPNIELYYVFTDNYAHFHLSTFEFSRRRVAIMYENGCEFDEKVLSEYGLR